MAATITKIVDPDNGSGTDYTSLSAWEAGMQKDLVSADEISVAKCRCTGGTADTTGLLIDGWTTDSTRYIKIWTDPSEGYRHNGTYQTGNKYRFEHSVADVQVDIYEDYIKVIGLEGYNPNASGYGWRFRSGAANAWMIVSHCVMKGAASNSGDALLIRENRLAYIYNNIIFDWGKGASVFGWDTGSDLVHFYNNTFQNCGTGIYSAEHPRCKVINNIAQDCTDGFYAGGEWVTGSNYNCSDIASDAPGANSQTGEVTFEDEGANDFHLDSTDTVAKGNGLNLYNDANLPFQDDIDGDDRGGSGAAWDIGADEHVAAGPTNYPRSLVGAIALGGGAVNRKGVLKRNQAGAI